MKVFLVRHGKSEEDFGGKRQYPTSKLASIGIRQAEKAGERLIGEFFNKIYASPWERARHTAEIIAKKLEKEFEIHPYIHEIESPKELQGAEKTSEVNKQFLREMKENANNHDWKFLGHGESLTEVLARARSFRDELIAKHEEENILVVSHGAFIGCLITTMIWGDTVPSDIRSLITALAFDNTGISMMEYDAEKKQWSVGVINEHQHILGL